MRRAPLAPIGFFVTWHVISWRGPQDVLDPRVGLFDVLGVVLDVAAVEHGVLRRGDVDEGGLHARQDVLHTSDVDVAVDLADVVGGSRNVMLDEVATLEHGHLREAVADLDAHRVAPDRTSVALTAAAFDDGWLDGGRRPFAATAAAAGRRLAARLLAGAVVATTGAGAAGAGRVSPIWGLRTSVRSATSGASRPSRGFSGSSGWSAGGGGAIPGASVPSEPVAAPAVTAAVAGSVVDAGFLRRRWPPRDPRRRLRADGASSPSAPSPSSSG